MEAVFAIKLSLGTKSATSNPVLVKTATFVPFVLCISNRNLGPDVANLVCRKKWFRFTTDRQIMGKRNLSPIQNPNASWCHDDDERSNRQKIICLMWGKIGV